MKKEFSIAVFEGHGVGPEIMGPAIVLLDTLQHHSPDYSLTFATYPAGAKHYAITGESLPESSLHGARQANAILMVTTGLPAVNCENGSTISLHSDLCKALGLYASVRPVRFVPQHKPSDLVNNNRKTDFVVLTENAEGFLPAYRDTELAGAYSNVVPINPTTATERLFRFAFRLAEQRLASDTGKGLVTCVDTEHQAEAISGFQTRFDWEASRFKSICSNHADENATSLRITEVLWELDVLVTKRWLGDQLSDLGASMMGGLGVAPSADIGDKHAVFHPRHEPASKLAGLGVANPFAMILSAAMMLDWLGHQSDTPALLVDAKRLADTVYRVLAERTYTTADLGGSTRTVDAAQHLLLALEALT